MREQPAPRTFMTMAEVQERLRLSRWTVQTLINTDPDFVTYKVGHRRLMAHADFDRFMAKKRQTKG